MDGKEQPRRDSQRDLFAREALEFGAVTRQRERGEQQRGERQPQRGDDERGRAVRLREADEDRGGGDSQYCNEQAEREDEADSSFAHPLIVTASALSPAFRSNVFGDCLHLTRRVHAQRPTRPASVGERFLRTVDDCRIFFLTRVL